ncbi:hypothetical protein LUZ60_010553 [Juncus effusus]|nr:hypothetical protein LUZ60_010553 [Juncus effusus]
MALSNLSYGFVFLSVLLFVGVTQAKAFHGEQIQQKATTMAPDNNDSIKEQAVYFSNGTGESFYGFLATLTVHNLSTAVVSGQTSKASFTILSYVDKPENEANEIEIGWTIDPATYGDTRPRFFTFSVGADGSGCTNLNCKNGFVVLNNSALVPGGVLENVTDITIKILKDVKGSGDWLLHYGHGDSLSQMGYFPKSMFNSLSDYAKNVRLGGTVEFNKDLRSPPMGSGILASDKPPSPQAASFSSVYYIGYYGDHFVIDQRASQVDCPSNYGLGFLNYDRFVYGGPGGCTP